MTDTISRERSRNYIRQLKGSVVFKGLAVAASAITLPLTIHYLGQEQYGVLSTLLSVMSWVVFFDLGIGNGMRYKVAEYLAKNELDEAVRYISSGYGLIGLISASLFVVGLAATFLIPWQTVFNTQTVSESTLQYLVLLVSFFVLFNFWIGLVNQIIGAVQKNSAVVFGQFVASAMTLALVWMFVKTTGSSILKLAVAYGLSPVMATIGISYWFYRKRKDLIPKLAIDGKHARPLLTLGGQLFIIQLAVLVLYTTDKILVTQLMGPEYVAQYDVVFKLFSIISLASSIITGPLASAYTDAFHRQDLAWIQSAIQKQLRVFALGILATLALIVLAKDIVKLWIGPAMLVPFPLVISMGLYVLIFSWSINFAYVLNATGKIKIQLYLAVFSMLANIPLAIFLVRDIRMGSSGVVLANCLCMLPFAILGPMKVYGIFRAESKAIRAT